MLIKTYLVKNIPRKGAASRENLFGGSDQVRHKLGCRATEDVMGNGLKFQSVEGL